MWPVKGLILLAYVLAGVNAQAQVYDVDQGANCDGSVYKEEIILDTINSYCQNISHQKSVYNVDGLYRFNMELNNYVSHYYLPLTFVDTDGNARRDVTPRHFAVVKDDCEFQHVAKFKYGPPDDLVVTSANRVICNPVN